jgi:hypothetical protein
MCLLSRLACPELRELSLQLLVTASELGPYLRCILDMAMASEDLLVVSHDLCLMGLDILQGRLNIIGREAEHRRNVIVAPALLDIIEHVIDSNARAGDFWPTPAIDNLGTHDLFSC